jgi:tRNA(adenine34) deaminase
MEKSPEFWMKHALKLAKLAEKAGEVPVGAVLVVDGELVASSGNAKERLPSPIAHAEIIVLHRAAQKLNRWRLSNATLYVTLEPCSMCAGALVQARLGKLVYATRDPKAGAVKSIYRITSDARLNHQVMIEEGVLAKESSELLKRFFKKRRDENRNLRKLRDLESKQS